MSVWAAFWPFRRSRVENDAETLVSAVTQIARQPAFFGDGRVGDTLDGRLEIMTLHAALAFIRLQRETGAEPLAQMFADRLFRQFDAGLREAGIGDLTVPKRMRRIARSFYGRLSVYAGAIEQQDRAALEAAIARNIFNAEPSAVPFALALSNYATKCVELQKPEPIDFLFRLDGWAPAPG